MVGDFPPPEILFDILLRLPPEDLVRCLCVSKAWYATIHDRQFINAHLKRSLETDSFRTLLFEGLATSSNYFCSLPFHDENDIIGGSGSGSGEIQVQRVVPPQLQRYNVLLGHGNGLLCIQNYDDGEVALWNPSIQKLKKIPTAPTIKLSTDSGAYSNCTCGFGYDSVNDDYKIVQAVEIHEKYDDVVVVSIKVNVYSLKSKSWKMIQSLPYIGYRFVRRETVFLNGAVIWVMQNKLDYNKPIIVTLDLATEQYHEFPAPVDNENNSVLELKVLRGSLCINVDYFYAQMDDYFDTRKDVWIMEEYGVTKSWTRLFSIGSDPWAAFYGCKPLFISKNGEMALLKIISEIDVNELFWFDIRKKSSKRIEICGLPCIFDATICSGSLLLLDDDSVIVRSEAGSIPNIN